MIGGRFYRPRPRSGFTNQIGQVRRQFVERHVCCLSDMSERTGELVRTPHFQNKQGGVPTQGAPRAPLAQSTTALSARAETSETAHSWRDPSMLAFGQEAHSY